MLCATVKPLYNVPLYNVHLFIPLSMGMFLQIQIAWIIPLRITAL
jgi:F0F1-type ATP synthase assembly protein I